MKTTANYGIRVLATGFMVLVFLSILLFWGRFFSHVFLAVRMPAEAREVEVSPLGVLPETIENDPNVDYPSKAVAGTDEGLFLQTLGFTKYIFSRSPGGDRSDVFWYAPGKAWMYFDRSSGRIVLRDTYRVKRADGISVERTTPTYYVGPDGMSESPEENVGRFRDPVPVLSELEDRRILYDRKLHRFFAIDRRSMSVTPGPELTDTVLRWPAAKRLDVYRYGAYIQAEPPTRKVLIGGQEQDANARYGRRLTVHFDSSGYRGRYWPVVDASGRVDLLDRQSLELIPDKGRLPAPETLFGQGSRLPSQLLKYRVNAICVGPEYEYIGMVAASVSRQGTSMAIAVFDKDGRQAKRGDTRAISYAEKAQAAAVSEGVSDGEARNRMPRQSPWIASSRAALFEVPWAPAVTACRYLLENVHPPILTVASFFLANRIDAGASHRTLFLIPNSFAAMHRDQIRQSIVTQFFGALWMILPAIGLAAFLAWRVARDARAIGLPGRMRTLWGLGTLAFGLPAYITYRMTRPAGSLVTCATCGQARRSDMDRCHLCNGPWDVPELVPPTWRVLDGEPQATERDDASEKVVDLGEQESDPSVKSL